MKSRTKRDVGLVVAGAVGGYAVSRMFGGSRVDELDEIEEDDEDDGDPEPIEGASATLHRIRDQLFRSRRGSGRKGRGTRRTAVVVEEETDDEDDDDGGED